MTAEEIFDNIGKYFKIILTSIFMLLIAGSISAFVLFIPVILIDTFLRIILGIDVNIIYYMFIQIIGTIIIFPFMMREFDFRTEKERDKNLKELHENILSGKLEKYINEGGFKVKWNKKRREEDMRLLLKKLQIQTNLELFTNKYGYMIRDVTKELENKEKNNK